MSTYALSGIDFAILISTSERYQKKQTGLGLTVLGWTLFVIAYLVVLIPPLIVTLGNFMWFSSA